MLWPIMWANLWSCTAPSLASLNSGSKNTMTMTKQYFRATNHKGQDALRQIMEKQNRLCYLGDHVKHQKCFETTCSNCHKTGHKKHIANHVTAAVPHVTGIIWSRWMENQYQLVNKKTCNNMIDMQQHSLTLILHFISTMNLQLPSRVTDYVNRIGFIITVNHVNPSITWYAWYAISWIKEWGCLVWFNGR